MNGFPETNAIEMTFFQTFSKLFFFSFVKFKQLCFSRKYKKFYETILVNVVNKNNCLNLYHLVLSLAWLQKPLLIVFIVKLSKALHWSLFPKVDFRLLLFNDCGMTFFTFCLNTKFAIFVFTSFF